jgi:hypothetical protein
MANPVVVLQTVEGREGFWLLSALPTNLRGYISKVEEGRYEWDVIFGSVRTEGACPNFGAAEYAQSCEAYRLLREVGCSV